MGYDELITRAEQVRDEITEGANTAERIGQLLKDMLYKAYCEVTVDGNDAVTVISNTGVPHPIVVATTERFAEGYSTKQGKAIDIEQIEADNSTTIEITAEEHGNEPGDLISIVGTTNFNGDYIVKFVDNNVFQVEAANPITASESAGRVLRGNQIICEGDWGIKRTSYSVSGTPEGNNKDYLFQLIIWKENLASIFRCTKCITETRVQNINEFFNVANSILIDWEEGDRIVLAAACLTDTTNLKVVEEDIAVGP